MNKVTKILAGIFATGVAAVWIVIIIAGNAAIAHDNATGELTERSYITSMVKLEYLNATEEKEPESPLTEDEYRMISITAYNSDFTDESSLLAVIRTIYNRVHDERFPDTVEEVLTAPKQFESCKKIYSYAKDAYDFETAKKLIDCVWIDGEDIFNGENVVFYAERTVPSGRICKGLTLVCVQGETAFYKKD
jgi:hypothetical protein